MGERKRLGIWIGMYDEKSQFVLFLKNNKKKNFFKINTIPKNITGKVHAK